MENTSDVPEKSDWDYRSWRDNKYYYSGNEKDFLIDVELEAGRTYYLQCTDKEKVDPSGCTSIFIFPGAELLKRIRDAQQEELDRLGYGFT